MPHLIRLLLEATFSWFDVSALVVAFIISMTLNFRQSKRIASQAKRIGQQNELLTRVDPLVQMLAYQTARSLAQTFGQPTEEEEENGKASH